MLLSGYTLTGFLFAGLISGGVYFYKNRFILKSVLKASISYYFPSEKQSFSIEGKIMKIPLGEFFVYLPFDEQREIEMSLIEVFGIDDKGNKIDLTQKPGVPYLFTAEDMGLEKIIVNDIDSSNVYEGKERLPI